MENLVKLFADVEGRTFRITTTSKGSEMIQQTERNALRASILQALQADFEGAFDVVRRGADGVMVEVPNQSIADGITNAEGSGGITIVFDVKVKDLSTDIQVEGDMYQELVDQAEQKRAEKAAKAKAKAERDASRRAKE